MASVAVILPAAGSGLRLGGAKKQFRILGDAPVLVQTIRKIDVVCEVMQIVVVVPSTDLASTRLLLGKYAFNTQILLVEGGATRQESVWNGISGALTSVDFLMVHDAVRPFVRSECILRLIQVAVDTGAASLAIPVTDTLRQVTEQKFCQTVPRKRLYQMQTPQIFKRQWLIDGHQFAMRNHLSATDDVELVQQIGFDVSLVKGSRYNMKITGQDDWELACQLWNEYNNER